MGIFDSLTGAGQARAQKTVRGLQGQTFDKNLGILNAANASARAETVGATDKAINTLTGARDAAGNQIRSGGTQAIGHIDKGVVGAQDALGKARNHFGQAGGAYEPLNAIAKQFDGSIGAYNDAIGLNGAEGVTRARKTFGNSLQNQFELEQGLEAINRSRAARGGGTINSGNIDRDTQVFGQDYANSKTNSHLDRLSGLVNQNIGLRSAVATGQANAANNIANSFGQEAGYLNAGGTSKAQIAADTAFNIARLTSATGTSVAGLQSGVGERLANLAQGRGNSEINLRQNYANTFGNSLLAERQARDDASGKVIALGVKAAELAAGIVGPRLPGLSAAGGGGAA